MNKQNWFQKIMQFFETPSQRDQRLLYEKALAQKAKKAAADKRRAEAKKQQRAM